MSRIYWDTMLFVYWLEDHPRYGSRMRQILQKMADRGDGLYTSSLTVGELLTGPYKKGDTTTADRIRNAMGPPSVEIVPFTREAAERYAGIRAGHGVSPADAIHLACAAEAGVDLFLTNDRNLVGRIIPGIGFVAGLDVNLF